MEIIPYITTNDTCLSPFIFLPSDDAEILCFNLFTGQLVLRFRAMKRNFDGRVTCISGRPFHHVLSSFILSYLGIIFRGN
jgi:hypothetical protein